MPSTPFHFPPNALVGLPLGRRVDLPTLMLANVVIDVEPLLIAVLGLGPPPHGYAHTLLGGAAVGAATGWITCRGARALAAIAGKPYPLGLRTAVLSGVMGCWLHVLLDAIMYSHLRPFFPVQANPLYWPGSEDLLHGLAAALLLPLALVIVRRQYWQTLPQQAAVTLLAVSAVSMLAMWAAGQV